MTAETFSPANVQPDPGDEPLMGGAPELNPALYEVFSTFMHEEGFDLDDIPPAQVPRFAHATHDFVNAHGEALIDARRKPDTGAAVLGVAPIPGTMFQHRLDAYYKVVGPVSNDRIHRTNRIAMRQKYVPAARRYQNKFPEIGFTSELHEELRLRGHEQAGDIMFDVLAGFGMVVHDLGRIAAERAAQNRVN